MFCLDAQKISPNVLEWLIEDIIFTQPEKKVTAWAQARLDASCIAYIPIAQRGSARRNPEQKVSV